MMRVTDRHGPVILFVLGLMGVLSALAYKSWQSERLLTQRTPLFSVLQQQNRELRRKVDHLQAEVMELKQSEDKHASEVQDFINGR